MSSETRRPYRFRWSHPATLALIFVMTFSVQRLLRAEPPTAPAPKDFAAAGRVEPAPRGTSDEREAPPPASTLATGYGIIEPVHPETRVAAPLPSRILELRVAEGQHVAVGDPLVVLDNAAETAALAAAVADVAGAKAQLERTARGSRSEEIQAALGDAETAKARAALSQGIADRLQSVAAAGATTVDELDRAKRQADADAASARAAEARRASILAGSRREDVELARAQLAAAQARRDQAQAVLDRLTVRAPIAGEILQSKYRAGEYYQPGGDPLITLGDTSHLTARMDVDERDVGKVVVGATVVVRADAYPGQDFAGTVRELGRRMGRKNVRSDDPAQRNDTKILEVVIGLDAPTGLIVGQRVTCYVVGGAPAR